MTTHTMTWPNIRRSWRRIKRRQTEDIIATVQRWLRNGADPADIKSVTGIPLHLISKIRTDHQDVVADVIRWRKRTGV